MSKSAKGSAFEREICRELSIWWTNDPDTDDIFWRTSASGARATQRRKKGKQTFGQNGDIQATNPIGQKLIDVCTIELKRGYSSKTFADLIDKPVTAADQQYEKFFDQVMADWQNSGSFTWCLITKRDRRDALIFIPDTFYQCLVRVGSEVIQLLVKCSLLVSLVNAKGQFEHTPVKVFKYSDFFSMLSPVDIKTIWSTYRG